MHWMYHIGAKQKVQKKLDEVRGKIDELIVLKEALVKRWAYHQHKQWGDK